MFFYQSQQDTVDVINVPSTEIDDASILALLRYYVGPFVSIFEARGLAIFTPCLMDFVRDIL